jgi:type IV pilus assembly protein PilP
MAMAVAGIACGGSSTTADKPPPPPSRNTESTVDAGKAGPTVVKSEFAENEFVESDRNRDPFRIFGNPGSEVRRSTGGGRDIVLSNYSVDELRLVAIVQASDHPRAMVVDPKNRGWILKRGDFVGKTETVHIGGPTGTDYPLNWRVDRVREEDLVLIREDPTQPQVPPATRIVPLHPEADKQIHVD